MSLPERTPLELVEMTGDREAAGLHPWDTQPPRLELGNYPAFPPTAQYDPDPMDLRDAVVCVFIGAVAAFIIGFILWGDKIAQRLAELF